ncbi:hypothetical protein ACIBHX_01780 [Nonomuraea sp. NPDC050536]|uniref:DUF7167 family protein n=1 Tax=Nonomuraea sp. NPDC050536 TaxID=3364366 RepID=UPI0037CA45E7
MSDEETIKLSVSLSIGIANCEQADIIDTGIPVAEWNSWTDEKRSEATHKHWEEWIWEYIDGGASVADSSEGPTR